MRIVNHGDSTTVRNGKAGCTADDQQTNSGPCNSFQECLRGGDNLRFMTRGRSDRTNHDVLSFTDLDDIVYSYWHLPIAGSHPLAIG